MVMVVFMGWMLMFVDVEKKQIIEIDQGGKRTRTVPARLRPTFRREFLESGIIVGACHLVFRFFGVASVGVRSAARVRFLGRFLRFDVFLSINNSTRSAIFFPFCVESSRRVFGSDTDCAESEIFVFGH